MNNNNYNAVPFGSLLNVDIRKNTKNGFLCISDLKKSYEVGKKSFLWSKEHIGSLMQGAKFKNVLRAILLENKDCESINEFNENVANLGVTKYLKKLKYWETYGARDSRIVFCEEKIWKLIYINLFPSSFHLSTPTWIREIPLDFYKFSIKREESREIHFIDSLIPELHFFLDAEPIKQYQIENYKYDLFIKLFDRKILIEYNEEYHAEERTVMNDLLKLEVANERDFFLVYVPVNKEYDVKNAVLEIIKHEVSLEDNYELRMTGFSDYIYLDRPMNTAIKKIIPNPNYSSYSIAINEKVFGKHITGMRNLASADQLKKITKIEQFITQGIEMGMIKNDIQIMYAIKNINI